MKKKFVFNTIEEIRNEIDSIDHEIILLLSQRKTIVDKAAIFKTNQSSVKAPERVKAMLEQRKRWAIENNLSPEFIDNLYKNIVDYFIARELDEFKKQNKD